MVIALVLVLIAINTFICMRSVASGIACYLAFSLMSPVLKVGSAEIIYEIAAFIPVFTVYIFRCGAFRYTTVHMLVMFFTAFTIISTLVSVMTQSLLDNMQGVFGIIRFAVVLFAAFQVLDQNRVSNIFLATLLVNMVVSMIQLKFPHTVRVFSDLYATDTQNNLGIDVQWGVFTRASGTFASPLNVGILAQLTFSLYYGRLLAGERGPKVMLPMIAAIVTGLLSLTKTCILGLPVMTTVGLIWYLSAGSNEAIAIRMRRFRPVFAFLLAAGVVIAIAIPILENSGMFIDWYLKYLTKPLDAFNTRFDSTNGMLVETIKVAIDNLLIGVGKTTIGTEFVGDNQYVVLLHDSGGIGLFLYLAIIARLFQLAHRRGDFAAQLLLFAFMLTGFTLPTMITPFCILVFCYAMPAYLPRRLAVALRPPISPAARQLRLAAEVPTL